MNSRRSKQGKELAAETEFSLVKAAAWAWYLHGSGGAEGKPVKESDPRRRSKMPPRPSRYKLEASAMKDQQCSTTTPPSPMSSILMDSYEIQSISRRLNYVLEDSFQEEYAFLIDDCLKSPIEIGQKLSPAQKVATGLPRGKGSRRNWMVRAATMCGSVAGGVEATLSKAAARSMVPAGLCRWTESQLLEKG